MLRAISAAVLVAAIAGPAFAQTENDVITSYTRGNQFKAAFRYDEADKEYKLALSYALTVYGEEHKNTALLLHEMGDLYEKQGKFDEADKHYTRALKARENVLGPNHPDVATELASLAAVAFERNKPDDAQKLLTRALAIREKKFGEESAVVADTLNDMAILASRRGNSADAEKLYRRSLIIREKIDGPNSLVVAQSLSNLGLTLHDLEQYKDAEDSHRRALAIREKAKGPNDPITAESLNNLAILLRDLGRYQEAEELHRRAFKIREAALGAENIKTASTVNNLAILCMDQGRYVEAAGMFRHAILIYVRNYGNEHPAIADALGNLAQLEKNRGRLAEAEQIQRQALAIVEKFYGKEHDAVVAKLNGLAGLLGDQAKYAEADAALRRALKIRETVYGPKHKLVADSLNDLANLAVDRGQPAEARPLLERAYRIRETAFGPEHPRVLQAANNLAIVLGKSNDRKSAEAILKKNLATAEKTFGKQHPAYADAVFNLAGCDYDAGRYAEAEAHYREALPLFEKILGGRHPHVADTLTYLGNCLREQEKFDAARQFHQQAREVMQKAFGQDHPAVLASLNNLAVDAWLDGKPKDALGLFDEQRKSARRYLLREAPFLSASEQREFLGSTDVDQLARALTFAREVAKDREAIIRAGAWTETKIHEGVARKSAEWIANGKATAIEARTVRTRLDRDITDPEARKALAEIIDLRAREAALGQQENGAGAANIRKLRTEHWVRRRLLEQTLASSSAGASPQWVELDSICKALPKDGVLVDIVRIRPARAGKKADGPAWDAPHYMAWVIPPAGDVTVVDLGEAVLIDDAVHAARKVIASSAERSRELGAQKAEQMAMEALQKISDLVLKPIAPQLKDVKYLIVSPDGDLWLAPWAALPFSGEQYLVETFVLRLVVSARDLVPPSAAAKLETAAPLVIADPNFDAPPVAGRPQLMGAEATGRLADFEATFVFGEAGKLSVRVPEGDIIGSGWWKQENDTIRMETERSIYAGTLVGRQLRGQRRLNEKPNAPLDPFFVELIPSSAPAAFANGPASVRPLPLTRPEGESTAIRLRAITGSEPYLLMGPRATEAAVKSAVRPKALVLATYGLYLPAPKDDAKGSDPLGRCGLILAGFNKRAAAGPGTEDGVLTGSEIVALDLRGTGFVALSGTDTGAAESISGDSVAGMRQAFQVAGAADVLDTLWPIPDMETARMMARFYDRLASGASRAEVLAAAQREAIRDRRQKNGAAHPYYWASLTLTGRD